MSIIYAHFIRINPIPLSLFKINRSLYHSADCAGNDIGYSEYRLNEGKKMKQQTEFSTQFDCDIRFRNHLDDHWLVWFEGLDIENLSDGETRATGTVPDQAALFGLLNKVRDLNVKVISIHIKALKVQS